MHMESIQFELIGQVGMITLNRPQVYNAFNREMALALQSRLDQCAADDGIGAVLLTGAGKAFCAGQDLQEVVSENGPSLKVILSEHYNPVITRIRALEKPVVAAVNGVAAGAGANIALACDVVVATESASFIQAFSKIGLIPDSGGTYHLPRLIGWQRASALMMTGDKIAAREALSMGMLYRVLPDESFAEEALKLAGRLAEMPTRALALTKKALNGSLENNLDQQLILEDRLQSEAGATDDYREGVAAFLEKRPARFKGK